MKYSRGQFSNEYYQLWHLGLQLPVPQIYSVYSIKYKKNDYDEYSRVTLKAVSVSDALERACYQVTLTSPWKPEDIELLAVYDEDENLLWIDEPFYNFVQKKNEFRGIERREFLKRFGATSAAILYGLQPSVAHGIIPFGFVRKTLPACVNTPGGAHIIGASGSSIYTTPGTYIWCVPAGVSSVCVVCIGGGGGGSGAFSGGAGGGLAYINNFSTSPGTSINVTVGAGGAASGTSVGNSGGNSSFSSIIAEGGSGYAVSWIPGGGFSGTSYGGTGGSGSGVTIGSAGTGGGAGGYGGNGGNGADSRVSGNGSPGGNGAGGGGAAFAQVSTGPAGGAALTSGAAAGGGGAVRVIWGAGRSFPNNAT